MNSIAVKNSDVARDGYLSLTDPLNDGYEWGKVSRVVADDIVRTRVEGGIPEMRVLGSRSGEGGAPAGGWEASAMRNSGSSRRYNLCADRLTVVAGCPARPARTPRMRQVSATIAVDQTG